MDSRSTLRRHVPTALAVIMLAGVALPAQANKTDQGHGKKGSPPPHSAAAQPGQQPPGKAPARLSGGHVQDPAPAPPKALGKPGKAKKALPAKGGKGKSAKAVAPATSKGKTGSASAGRAVTPSVAAVAPPVAPAPAQAPAAPTSPQPDGGKTDRPATSRPLDESRPRPRARTGTGVGAAATAATVAPTSSAPTAAGALASPSRGDAARDRGERDTGGAAAPRGDDSGVTRTVRDVVEVVPEPLKAALALLAALAILLGGSYALAAVRARRLGRQRRELMQEVGLLQAALLPPVPEQVGAVRASVAYRPSEGPGAGGDFYDAMTLPGGRAAFILGDVSGHGREALAHTAFMRYTLRAYLEAGLEPRLALQVAERAVGGQLEGDFATVIVAVHDPAKGSLTYASAGHPAPIITGGARHEPVMAAWSPPIGWGLPTGLRQTTVPLPSGAIACLYTDGLAEAPTEDGILGRARLAEVVREAGRDATAQDVLDRVAAEAVLVRDDMAACLIAPARHVSAAAFRTELLEIGPSELHEGLAVRFLEECNVPAEAVEAARTEAQSVVAEHAGALMVVKFGVRGSRVEVLPRNVESLQAAALRKSAARP